MNINNLLDRFIHFDQPVLLTSSIILSALITSILSIFYTFLLHRKLPIAHSVAIIGFPKSGKTTLITSLFAEIFARRIPYVSITPRGEETIKRINDDIYRLENGNSLGPTTDQDLFAYRAELIKGGGLFSRRFKFEVGDFPGEDSEEFSTKEIEWLHDLPYFKWVMEADAFVFVVDIQKILKDKPRHQYRSLISKAFRASWQRLKDYHYEGKLEVGKKPVVLVFSKSDLLLQGSDIMNDRNGITGQVEEIDEMEIADSKKIIIDEYSDLIAYFESECVNFRVVFTSAYKKSKGTRVGMREVLRGVMPR